MTDRGRGRVWTRKYISPNSVYHGAGLKMLGSEKASRIERDRLTDFIDYLF